MLSTVVDCVDGVAVSVPTPTEVPPPTLEEQLVALALNRAHAEFLALVELCPGWQACPHHNLLVGRRFGRFLAMKLVLSPPRAYALVGGVCVPCWS